ncbi:uncharacterized protein LOC135499471 isoform X2 [Lineus longissimus]|uniref:uncharacterized protein LOC135499471 isoform X2 n=1 Tax=Lineus longissimus TaxID=88925 RepID=UPI002B4FAA31
MDTNSSDQSPPLSEHAGSSWLPVWEHESSSLSALNLGSSSSGLNGLVEDKEIAAKAVAFVVNSTRKGIVPLCADVATIFRIRRSLEHKVSDLQRENDILRSQTNSIRTSQSTSPAPPSLVNSQQSHSNSAVNRSSQTHDKDGSRPCSRCSRCSSIVCSSPKPDKTNHIVHPTNSSIESLHISNVHPPNGITTRALVHHQSDESMNSHVTLTRERKNSLPEMTSEPNKEVPKISPVAQVCKEVQCVIIPSQTDVKLEEQFRETVKLNSKLAEELGAARKEIEILKGRLKEFEMNNLARHYSDQLHYEDECMSSDTSLTNGHTDMDVNAAILPIIQNSKHKHHRSSNSSSSESVPGKSKHGKKSSPSSSIVFPSPIPGCKCSSCETLLGSGGTKVKNGFADNKKFHINGGKHYVNLDDHVVVKGERAGYIRYIGHLDIKIGQPNMVFVGVELDAPVGRHDGFFNGKRYFYCHKDHGVFLPLQDVVCIITKKIAKKLQNYVTHTEVRRRPSSESERAPPTKSSPKRDKTDKSGKAEQRLFAPDALTGKSIRETIMSSTEYVDV